jgi:hypothetical protein
MLVFQKIRDIHPGDISVRREAILFHEAALADIIKHAIESTEQGMPKECWGLTVELNVTLDLAVPPPSESTDSQ